MAQRHFGELPGIPVGTTWSNRAEVARTGVHRPTMTGISGTRAEGADSIVVSGGYEDDQDHGDEILYTGAGGNDPASGKQIKDQDIAQPGIAGLITSQLEGLPVRVVRGARGHPTHSPPTGFRYDGLYRVAEHWSEVGLSGFRVWRFQLIRLSPQEAISYIPPVNLPLGHPNPGRATGITTRIVRSTAVSDAVKRLYDGACQVCDTRLEVPGRVIAEGAHIRGLGGVHGGPDVPENVLCLCPNHHSMFDQGGIFIDDIYRVRDYGGVLLGPLSRNRHHSIAQEYLQYHRDHWGH